MIPRCGEDVLGEFNRQEFAIWQQGGEIHTGENIPEGLKSWALNAIFRKTLLKILPHEPQAYATNDVKDVVADVPLEVGQSSSSSGIKTQKSETDQPAAWQAPVLFDDVLPSVESLDPELIPVAIREFCLDVATRLNVPVAYPAAAVVTVIGSVIGRSCAVRPKMYDPWKPLPNLWCALIAPSSIGKSPILEAALKPVYDLESACKKASQDDFATREILGAKLSAVKSKMQAEFKTFPNQPSSSEATYKEILENFNKSATVKRYIVNDATDPSLCDELAKNPRGLLQVRDELTGFLGKLEKEHYSPALYLELWNGNARISQDRRTSPSTRVEAGCLSILGGIQPAKLLGYVREAYRNGASDGFLPRFQLAIWADDFGDWKFTDLPPNREALRNYSELIKKIDELTEQDFRDYGAKATQDDEHPIPFFAMSTEAYELFKEYQTATMGKTKRDNFGQPEDEFLGKMGRLFAALALIFHVINVVSGTSPKGDISESAALQAGLWCANLEQHHRKIIALAKTVTPSRELARKIEKGDVLDGMRVREIGRKEWSGLNSSAALNASFAELEDRNWLRIKTEETEGRSAQVIRLNPGLKKSKKGGENG